jgi:RNA polymerase sigma-70 factor, ECF subfamily
LNNFKTYSDDALLALLKQSDELAFKELYERYKSQLGYYAINILHNTHEASDIIQEVFLSLWKRREALEIKISFKAWLYNSVRNMCLMNLANEEKQSRLIQQLSAISTQHADHFSALEIRELQHHIDTVITSMPERMQSAFTLSRNEQISHAEVGARLSMAEGTVKKHVQNALKIIRKEVISSATIMICLLSKNF